MSALRRIALSLPIAILLIFGSSGVGLVRCACTGHVSILLPTDKCCSGTENCMQFSISKVSDANLATESTSGQVPEVDLFYLAPFIHFFSPIAQPLVLAQGFFTTSPPPLVQMSMVMRI